VMGEMMPMEKEGWMILTKRLVAAFAAMALANEIVWRTQSTEFWVTFETFVLPGFLFVVFMFQAKLFERYMVEKDEG
jgi:intracellular septation protein